MQKFTFLLFLANVYLALSLQCRDESGSPIDWYYIYKLPKEANHVNPLVREGEAYLHITPSRLHEGWVLSDVSIADPQSMPGQTLAPIYEDNDIVSLVYNDQPPHDAEFEFIQCLYRAFFGNDGGPTHRRHRSREKLYDRLIKVSQLCKKELRLTEPNDDFEFGHTKGVILGDNDTAMWLVHSVPKFPPVPANDNIYNYTYPKSGKRYGQTFLCMSVATPTLELIATQLKYNEPMILHSSLPKALEGRLPNLRDVVSNKSSNQAPWYHTQGIETIKGRKFLSFAKSHRFHDDLYSGLVASSLQSDLLVETWCNGPGNLDSECSLKYEVHNVKQLSFASANVAFTSHHDHSKWAVANRTRRVRRAASADYWVCVGDINRAVSQESRGGGTVCTAEPILWHSFTQLIGEVQNCA